MIVNKKVLYQFPCIWYFKKNMTSTVDDFCETRQIVMFWNRCCSLEGSSQKPSIPPPPKKDTPPTLMQWSKHFLTPFFSYSLSFTLSISCCPSLLLQWLGSNELQNISVYSLLSHVIFQFHFPLISPTFSPLWECECHFQLSKKQNRAKLRRRKVLPSHNLFTHSLLPCLTLKLLTLNRHAYKLLKNVILGTSKMGWHCSNIHLQLKVPTTNCI